MLCLSDLSMSDFGGHHSSDGPSAGQCYVTSCLPMLEAVLQIAAEDTNPETAYWLAQELERIAEEELHWRGRLWKQGTPCTDDSLLLGNS